MVAVMSRPGGRVMAKPLLPDELWAKVEPLLPPPKPRRDIFPARKPVERHGVPLGATTTAANTPDVAALPEVVDAVPPVRGRRGRPRRRPKKLYGDRAYDSDPHRAAMRRRGIDPRFARRRTPQGSGLGVHRRVVEALFPWLHRFRRPG